MRRRSARIRAKSVTLLCGVWLCASAPAVAELCLGPETFVQANGADIVVPGYSVPSYVRWDGDELADLIVGEGGDGFDGKVRVYLNVGVPDAPAFADCFYAQSDGADLVEVPAACLGAFPRVVDWNNDARKDLLVGNADGTVRLYLNVGTDAAPTFDCGSRLQVGVAGSKTDIDVGLRATPMTIDWNGDGRKDLVVGAYDGKIHVFINEGTDTSPDFVVEQMAQDELGDLVVFLLRSSPDVCDLDGDGRPDLLAGNTDGHLLRYTNIGTSQSPLFSSYVFVAADGVAIDLPGAARSRPFLCDWTGDGRFDVLIGGDDGKVHLFEGAVIPGDFDIDQDVDADDLAFFRACVTGPGGGPLPSQCIQADLDLDEDVDQADFGLFQRCITGPDHAGVPVCLD